MTEPARCCLESVLLLQAFAAAVAVESSQDTSATGDARDALPDPRKALGGERSDQGAGSRAAMEEKAVGVRFGDGDGEGGEGLKLRMTALEIEVATLRASVSKDMAEVKDSLNALASHVKAAH